MSMLKHGNEYRSERNSAFSIFGYEWVGREVGVIRIRRVGLCLEEQQRDWNTESHCENSR